MSEQRKTLICQYADYYPNNDIRLVVESKNYDPAFKVGSDVHVDGCAELGKIVRFERLDGFIALRVRPFHKDKPLHSPGSNMMSAGEILILVGKQSKETLKPQPKQLRYVYFVSYKTPISFGRCEVKKSSLVNNIQDIKEMEDSIRDHQGISHNESPVVIQNFQLLRTEEI